MFLNGPDLENIRSDSMISQMIRQAHRIDLVAFGRRMNHCYYLDRPREPQQRQGVVNRSYGFAAAVPGDSSSLERTRLHDGGYDQDRATTSQDDRMSDRKWMTLRRALPLVLTKDDNINVTSFVTDALSYVTFRLKPVRLRQALCCLFAENRCGRARVHGQL